MSEPSWVEVKAAADAWYENGGREKMQRMLNETSPFLTELKRRTAEEPAASCDYYVTVPHSLRP